MPTFNSSGFQNYTWDGSNWIIDGSPTVTPITATDVNGDNEADIGEDVTGQANTYAGYVTIGGTDYLVVYGSDEVPVSSGNYVTDTNTISVAMPAIRDPNTFPFPSQIAPGEITAASFTYCFAEGTTVTTSVGEIAVEDLDVQHEVLTAAGTYAPVKWVGRQTLNTVFSPERALGLVRIAAGALGDGVPSNDLTVTSDHGIVLEGIVINASALVNGTTVQTVPRAEMAERITVYHVETEDHAVIYANGTPAETFIDAASRKSFDNYAEYLELYGAERIIPEMSAPRISAQRLLPQSIREQLGIAESLPDFLTA